jgi:predicted transcriptional regulator
MTGSGWNGPNRQKRERSRRRIRDAVAQQRRGEWFTALALDSGLSATTNRKYLDEMAASGKVEEKRGAAGARGAVLYRRPAHGKENES